MGRLGAIAQSEGIRGWLSPGLVDETWSLIAFPVLLVDLNGPESRDVIAL